MKTPGKFLFYIALAAAIAMTPVGAFAASPKYAPNVPEKITTPDTVETRIGTLRFTDGTPNAETVDLAYDQLDFGRGVDAFLKGMSATSVHALCRGFEDAGIKLNQGMGITEDLMDARSLFLTANTTTVYVLNCIDVSDGPMVVRIPPRVLGPVDDADFRWVTDVGLTGPDKGAGGDYLFVPPGYTGTLPETGYYVVKPRTNRMLMFYRAFVEKGDIQAAVAGVKAGAAIFPLSQAATPPATSFVNISGKKFNTISANDFSFYEELNAVVQNEPADWVDPDTVGLYASIGIRKGQPFAPDARMKKILKDSVAVADAIARSNLFLTRSAHHDLHRSAMVDAFRGRQLSVPQRCRAPARRAHDVLLLRYRHHTRHDRIEAGHRFRLRDHRPRREGGLPGWQPHLQGDPAGTHPREGLLVLYGL